jgi:hypothetical protein
MRAFGAAAAAFHAKTPDRGRAGARRERHRLVTTRKARADESARGASAKRVRDGRARGVGVGPARVDPSRWRDILFSALSWPETCVAPKGAGRKLAAVEMRRNL